MQIVSRKGDKREKEKEKKKKRNFGIIIGTRIDVKCHHSLKLLRL